MAQTLVCYEVLYKFVPHHDYPQSYKDDMVDYLYLIDNALYGQSQNSYVHYVQNITLYISDSLSQNVTYQDLPNDYSRHESLPPSTRIQA